MWFKVEYNKLALLLLPDFLRGDLIIAYVQTLFIPIDKLYYLWYKFRTENLYKVKHTGQICYLRKALNDKFDFMERRIYIGNGNTFIREYLYTTAENRTRFLGTMYLNKNEDYADTGVDFVVFVPLEIMNTLSFEVKALIEFYKLGGKRYKIETI